MIEISVSLIILIISAYLLYKAREVRRETLISNKKRSIDTAQLRKNNISLATKAIEAQIITFNNQKNSLNHLLAELEEQELTCYEDEEEKYDEIIRCMRINSEALDSTEEALDRLETWYFMTHGKHFMKIADIHLFQDEEKNFSLN